MWLITGAFDGRERGDISVEKTKLLKTGKRYTMGRKGCQLLINHSKVSSSHGEFIVGDYTAEDVANPSSTPSLRLYNNREKATIQVLRDGTLSIVNPQSTYELQDGDVVHVVVEIPLKVRWHKVCCYSPATRGRSAISIDACAALGVNMVHTSHPDITHHLTPTFSMSPALVTSLLSASQIVKPEWLSEVIRLGDLPVNNDSSSDVSLEQTYALPLETKFRPTFSPSLPPPLKVFRVWEPNEERIQMLKGYRFLFVGEKGREVTAELKDLVVSGGGKYEGFSADAGRVKWHQVLAKGKQKVSDDGKGLVLVSDKDRMTTAIGAEKWKELVDEARTYALHFITPEHVMEAVVNTDTSRIDCNTDMDAPDSAGQKSSSPVPDIVPNTHPDEPSIPPPSQSQSYDLEEGGTSRKLRRRATPSAASRPSSPGPSNSRKEPTPEVETGGAPAPRKILTRRARPQVPAFDIGDASAITDSDSFASIPTGTTAKGLNKARSPSPADNPIKVTQTAGRSSRLKRRAGTTLTQVIDIEDVMNVDAPNEPPLKKFKALFEESDPNHVPESGISAYSGGINMESGANSEQVYNMIQSQTQSLTQAESQIQSRGEAGRDGGTRTKLPVVAEEEEENTALVAADDRGDTAQKPEAPGIAADSVPSGVSGKPLSKAAKTNALTSRIKQPKKSGAAPGKPDTDSVFLKAVASMKKSKKHEDSFDREFNQLRISKPDLERDEAEKEWHMIDDFGDYNVRGNFMVVVEMDIPEKENGTRFGIRRGEGRLDWEGKSDFKKFKRKAVPEGRAKVDLVVSEDKDYGMGNAYWKGTQSQSQPNFSTSDMSPPSPKQKAKSQRQPLGRRSQKGGPSQQQARTDEDLFSEPETQGKNQPLFLDGDDDDMEIRGEDVAEVASVEDEAPPTLRSVEDSTSQGSKPAPRKRKAQAPVIVDDDSDDGTTFKGFQRKKRKVK